MFGTILKATNSSFQKGMICCRSIYVKKVMKLLAFIFEQPSYTYFDFTLTKQVPTRTRIQEFSLSKGIHFCQFFAYYADI